MLFFHFYTQKNEPWDPGGVLGIKRALPYIGLDVHVYVNVWKLKGQDSHSFVFLLSSCIGYCWLESFDLVPLSVNVLHVCFYSDEQGRDGLCFHRFTASNGHAAAILLLQGTGWKGIIANGG